MRKKILYIFLCILVIFFVNILLRTFKIYPIIVELLFNREISLKKTEDNITILILGTGSGSHEGPNLTDTIIFANINPKKNTVHLISIPRDLWIPELEGKVNIAYAEGENVKKGGGLLLSKSIISKILDRPINYAVKIDFDGFVKAVDLVGGIDINVETEFDDYQYPLEDKREDLCGHTLEEATQLIATQSPLIVFPCRYEHVHFDKGPQHMSGETALIFVRSRYATGSEGSDFARSLRQQKVIQAFREKVFSINTFLNPLQFSNLYTVLENSIDTDINSSEFDDFIKLASKMKKAKIISEVIEAEDPYKNKPGLLTNPPLTDFGAWVLIPRIGNGKYAEIQNHVQCILTAFPCVIK